MQPFLKIVKWLKYRILNERLHTFPGPKCVRIDVLGNFSLNYDINVYIFIKTKFSDFLNVKMILLVDLQRH